MEKLAFPGPAEPPGRRGRGIRQGGAGLGGRSGTTGDDQAQHGDGTGDESAVRHGMASLLRLGAVARCDLPDARHFSDRHASLIVLTSFDDSTPALDSVRTRSSLKVCYGEPMPKRYGQACPVAESLELVGERWTLLIVRDLLRGPARFQDLRTMLPGIPPKLLSERLKFMHKQGLVERTFYSDYPPRARYALTDKGRELGMV